MGTGSSTEEKKEPINLLWGKPAPSLIPTSELAVAAQRILSDPTISITSLQYGDSPHAGYTPLRQRLSAFLSSFYGCTENIEHLCITGGASPGLTIILQMLSDPALTKSVWMAAPCYFAARKIFEEGGLAGKLRGVNELDDGSIDLDYLEQEMTKLDSQDSAKNVPCKPMFQKFYTHLIYIVPTFANPSGKTMPLACRQALVNLARAHNALIIADDIYDMLQWPSPSHSLTPSSPLPSKSALPRLIDIDRALPLHTSDPNGYRHALSNGSFSKIVAPGVRTGWVDAAPALVKALAGCGATISGGCPSQLVAAMLAQLIDKGWLERHVRQKLVPAYQRRRALMVEVVEREIGRFGGSVVDVGDSGFVGGFFVWVRLPENVLAIEVARVAKQEEDVVVPPGPLFGVSWDEQEVDLRRFMRLSFSYQDEVRLEEGVRRLGTVIGRLLNGSS